MHNKSVTFRPVEIDFETDREIFGEKLSEQPINSNVDVEKTVDMEEWEEELAMQIDDF